MSKVGKSTGRRWKKIVESRCVAQSLWIPGWWAGKGSYILWIGLIFAEKNVEDALAEQVFCEQPVEEGDDVGGVCES
jgi:hypothetical protein